MQSQNNCSTRIEENEKKNITSAAVNSQRMCNETNQVWRKMVVEWCYSIIDHVGADREIVYITMNILDRYMAARKLSQTSRLTKKRAYETAVLASLLITTKLYAEDHICMRQLVQMSSSSITTAEIMSTAKDMYKTLSWQQTIPTAARFVHALLELLPDRISATSKAELFENATYQIELSVQDEVCSREPPSLIAWMVLENALEETTILSEDECRDFSRLVSEATNHDSSMMLRIRLRVNQCAPNEVSVDGEIDDDTGLDASSHRPQEAIPTVISCDALPSLVKSLKRGAEAENDAKLHLIEQKEFCLHRSKRNKCLHTVNETE